MSEPDSASNEQDQAEEGQAQSDPRFYLLRDVAAAGDYEAAGQMIEQDPTIVAAKNSIGETALHFLVVENYLEAVEFLAGHGSDVNSRNDFGQSALYEAAQLGYLEMIDLLLRLGARPGMAEGPEIVQAAKRGKRKQIAAVLQTHGVAV